LEKINLKNLVLFLIAIFVMDEEALLSQPVCRLAFHFKAIGEDIIY